MSCQRENFSGTLVDASKNLNGGSEKKERGLAQKSKHGRELLSAELRVRARARACVRSRKAGRRREWRSVVAKGKKEPNKEGMLSLGVRGGQDTRRQG